MKMDLIKHTIINTVKSLAYGQEKPERKFMRCILENMMEYRTTVLSNLGNIEEKSTKEWRNYYTRHLGKVEWANFCEKVEKVAIGFIGNITEDNVFCFDSVDTNKNSAKKMEGIKKVRDGSKGTLCMGFVWHGVSIKGIPLFLHREKLEADDKDKGLRFEIFERQVEKIRSTFGAGKWILADRLYDDAKKFNLLINAEFKFAIRGKTNRNITILEGKNAGEVKKLGDLEEGRYRVKIKDVEQDLFIYVKMLKGQTKPIRVISNVDDEEVVEKYLKRWEIERIFKTGKQEFDFEKIGTHKIQKTENLVYMVQLCLGISAYVYNKLVPVYEFNEAENPKVTVSKIVKKIKPFLKRRDLTLNRNSITSFIAYYMKYVRKIKFRFKKVTVKPCFCSQLSLNI